MNMSQNGDHQNKSNWGLKFSRRLDRLLSVGIVATDPQLVRQQRCVNVGVFATAGSASSHLLFNSFHNFHGLFVVNIFNLIMIFGALLVPQLHRFNKYAAATALVLLVLISHTFIVWLFGLASGLQLYFTLGGAVVFFFGVQNWRLFLLFFGLFLLALLNVISFAPVHGIAIPEDHAFRELLSSQALINTIVINAALLFYALSALRSAEVKLQSEHERSETLIEAVMPQQIAARLKSGRERRIADQIDSLTVLFADLVGFTSAAQRLAPDKVVEFLDRLVCVFDALAKKHSVEKIKTIGDCYMAAAGFDGRDAESAVAIGRFALSMMGAIDRLPPLGDRKLKLRIGIHCGEATAGIIGATRFSYDVWGAAVNFASRMESHGTPDRIQVSEAYRNMTKNVFNFKDCGTTNIKGLGATPTFFLAGEKFSGSMHEIANHEEQGDACDLDAEASHFKARQELFSGSV